VNVNNCDENGCFNGGQCMDKLNGFTCVCLRGFQGPRCEGDVNECLSNPCNPQGSLTCIQLNSAFLCVCREGWGGVICEELLVIKCHGPGFTGPCLNGGKCLVDSSDISLTCLCQEVYNFMCFVITFM